MELVSFLVGADRWLTFFALNNNFISFVFCSAEMWFGIAFAVVVEIVPLQIRSTTIGLFLFVINNIGGNMPILVDPVGKGKLSTEKQ